MAKLGLKAKLYVNSGDYAIPSWDEVSKARDVTLNLEKAEVDFTNRGTDGWEAILGGLKKGTLEFDVIYDPANAQWQALRDAWLSDGGTIELAIMDGEITTSGNQGLRATMSVLNMNKGEPLEGAQTTSFTAKPAPAANAPEWMTVA